MTENKAQIQLRNLAAVLHDRVAEVYGESAGIDGLLRLSGGASRETWSFDALLPNGDCLPLILKRDPIDEKADNPSGGGERYLGVDRWTEGRLMQLAGEAGVPTPEVPFFLEANERTSAGFVMQRLEGEALGRRILREDAYAQARPKLAFQCGEAAARFHNIPPDRLPKLQNLTAAEALDYNRDVIDGFKQPHAGFEYGFHWLREHLELAGERVVDGAAGDGHQDRQIEEFLVELGDGADGVFGTVAGVASRAGLLLDGALHGSRDLLVRLEEPGGGVLQVFLVCAVGDGSARAPRGSAV